MTDRSGIFAGDNPFDVVRDWLAEARQSEVNDPNAVTLATVDSDGMPNARIVLLKNIENDAFVFYTNYNSKKAQELDASGKAALVIHWKTLRRQIRIRGKVEREEASKSDTYFASRSVASRLGAWASKQSEPLKDREELVAAVAQARSEQGSDPARPPHWGGFCIRPVEIEFWADGPNRLHDRFRWNKDTGKTEWVAQRLNP